MRTLNYAAGCSGGDSDADSKARAAAAGFPRPQSKEFGQLVGPFSDAVIQAMEGTLAPGRCGEGAHSGENEGSVCGHEQGQRQRPQLCPN